MSTSRNQLILIKSISHKNDIIFIETTSRFLYLLKPTKKHLMQLLKISKWHLYNLAYQVLFYAQPITNILHTIVHIFKSLLEIIQIDTRNDKDKENSRNSLLLHFFTLKCSRETSCDISNTILFAEHLINVLCS